MIVKQKRITREDLQANPHVGYLFGDNLQREGLGGQAKEMRGEPNAIGVPTKRAPHMGDTAFLTDREYFDNISDIDKALEKCNNYEVIVIPLDGIGTGLAQLQTRAPRTYKYLQFKLNNLQCTSSTTPPPLGGNKTS
jgi:hypothetical protein